MPEIHPSILVGGVTALIGLAAWIGRMTEFKSTTTRLMGRIENKIDKLFERLPSLPVATGSPLRLTEMGKAISEKLDLSTWAGQEAERFREYLAGKSAYDIQEFCFNYVRNDFKPSAEQEAAIKECAFENGIEVSGVKDVLAVELRDVLLGDQEPSEHRSTG